MATFVQDVRYSIRMLLKSPGFSFVAILTLALGIGANTAIFSVINSVLLRPLPFHRPEQLVDLRETEASPGAYPLTGPDYLDWQSQNHTLEATSLYTWEHTANTSGGSEAETATVVSTQANFFSVLGVQPSLGRAFATGEDAAGKNHVVILSYGFWQRHFGGRTDIIGQSVALDNESYTMLGVMPQWFNFPAATDIWTPMDMTPKALGTRGSHSYRALARMKPGVAVSQAHADLVTIAQRLAKQYPDANGDVSAIVLPLKERLTRSSKSELLILLGAVALVLLVACANVANLLLARATGRQREMAVRAAMGASRWRLVRQLLTESVLLSLTGAALGLVGALWSVAYLKTADTLPIPRANPVEVDVTVLLFTIGVSLLVGLLFGLAPALQTSQVNLNDELKFSAQAVVSPSATRRLLRDALVVGEIAVSLALLVGAGLLLRSFAQMRNADIGVRTENVITLGINLPETKYSTLAARRGFYDQLLTRVSGVPGVQAESISTTLPLEGGNNGYITVPGDTDPAHAAQLVEWAYITPDYFRTMGIPFLGGSNFTAEDVQRTADVNLKAAELWKAGKDPSTFPPDFTFVAVINHAMAQTFWPNQDAVGKIFKASLPVKVIGIVGDVKEGTIREKARPQAYFALPAVLDWPGFGTHLVVKTAVAPASVLGPIRREFRDLDSSIALSRPRTMEQVISDNMQDTSVQTFLLGIFAALALVLAAVGIYGVMAYLVTQRTHELGIRMALGAQQKDVLRLVLGHGTKLTVLGVAFGIVVALGLTRLIAALLFGVGARDPLTFSVVAIVLAVVALAACYIPARRAARVDPMVALRYE
ncbi:MAG TPA: ABC transporter permease [Candidatus Acidoferrum sp.]|nr:ABC transporter permease [Candidatus Acidoferrum sp.]